MFEVKIFDLGYCKDEELTRVICVSKYKDKYVFSYNKKEMVGRFLVDILKKEKLGKMQLKEKCMKKQVLLR